MKRTATLKEEPKDWYFTFGQGQKYMGKYVKVHGSFHDTRMVMFKHFGAKWSMQYEKIDMDKIIARYGTEELILPTESSTTTKGIP